MRPDFSQLYAQLDLTPACSLDQLKHAYRRRIAELHPDRLNAALPAGDSMPVSELNAIYAAALRFHRQYGRLPGARPRLEPRRATVSAVRSRAHWLSSDGTSSPATAAVAPAGKYRALVIAGVVTLLLLAFAALMKPPSVMLDASVQGLAAIDVIEEPGADLPLALELGMTPDVVRAIQGAPVHVRGDHWDYGPSWLSFNKGRLSDWHSSPLSPLKTTTRAPPPAGTLPAK